MPKYALKCWTSNENYNADFDYALVDLTPALVATINARRNIYNVCAAQDSRLSSMEFFDYSPEYFAECDVVQWAEDTHDDHDPEFLTSLLDGSEVELIPAAFTPEDKDGNFRTDCDRMVMCEDGVSWCCVPKHSSIEITTANIFYRDFPELFAVASEVTANA